MPLALQAQSLKPWTIREVWGNSSLKPQAKCHLFMGLKTAFDTTLRQDPGNLVLSFTLEMGMLFFLSVYCVQGTVLG